MTLIVCLFVCLFIYLFIQFIIHTFFFYQINNPPVLSIYLHVVNAK